MYDSSNTLAYHISTCDANVWWWESRLKMHVMNDDTSRIEAFKSEAKRAFRNEAKKTSRHEARRHSHDWREQWLMIML